MITGWLKITEPISCIKYNYFKRQNEMYMFALLESKNCFKLGFKLEMNFLFQATVPIHVTAKVKYNDINWESSTKN